MMRTMQWFDKSQTQYIRAQPRIQTSRICQTQNVAPQSTACNHSMQGLTSIAYMNMCMYILGQS